MNEFKIIVESRDERRIGEIFSLPEFEMGQTRYTPARIVRQATEEEYIASCLADPSCPEENKKLMVITGAKLFWYEVVTD